MFKRRRLGQVLSIHESCSSLCCICSLVDILWTQTLFFLAHVFSPAYLCNVFPGRWELKCLTNQLWRNETDKAMLLRGGCCCGRLRARFWIRCQRKSDKRPPERFVVCLQSFKFVGESVGRNEQCVPAWTACFCFWYTSRPTSSAAFFELYLDRPSESWLDVSDKFVDNMLYSAVNSPKVLLTGHTWAGHTATPDERMESLLMFFRAICPV